MLKGNKIYVKDGVPKVYINDPDALRYIAAVQAADQQSLEPAVRKAITDFIVGCKADGIWSAIKASCILAGARTLSGALTPLVGAAPTNNNFVSGDYDRKTGLKGNGSNKRIDTGRAGNADPESNRHIGVYLTEKSTVNANVIGCSGSPGAASRIAERPSNNDDNLLFEFGAGTIVSGGTNRLGLLAGQRNSPLNFQIRINGVTTNISQGTLAPTASNYFVFSANATGSHADSRIAFYSIGQILTLATLDTRVTNLYNAIGAAIP
jgi:hypothetical protein